MFFSPCHSVIRRFPFNHFWDEPNFLFLVRIGSPASSFFTALAFDHLLYWLSHNGIFLTIFLPRNRSWKPGIKEIDGAGMQTRGILFSLFDLIWQIRPLGHWDPLKQMLHINLCACVKSVFMILLNNCLQTYTIMNSTIGAEDRYQDFQLHQ